MMFFLGRAIVFLTLTLSLSISLPHPLAAQNNHNSSGISVTHPENLIGREDVRFRDTTRTFRRAKFEGLRKRYDSMEGVVMVGITNEHKEVLLRGPDQWAPPGGAVKPGENWAAAARRIIKEQTGAAINIEAPVLVEQMTFKPNDGADEQFTAFILHFQASPVKDGNNMIDNPGGKGKTTAFRWFGEVPEGAHPNHEHHIKLYLD